MNVKPDERPKVVVLAIGIVLVLCMFGFTVVPRLLPHGPHGELLIGSHRSTSSATATTQAPARANVSTTAANVSTIGAGTAPFTAGTAPAAGTVAATPIPVPTATATDPFWRPLALSLKANKSNIVPVRPPVVGLPKPSAFKPGSLPNSGSVKLAPIAPPPMPEVALQGIVQDDTAMAVLEIGGQSRFLKAGETLEGGWVLTRIQTATVVLRQGKREVVLTLGQSLPKEAPSMILQENRDIRGFAQTLPPFHTVTLQP